MRTTVVFAVLFGGGWVVSWLQARAPAGASTKRGVGSAVTWVALTLGFAGWLYAHHGAPAAQESDHTAWPAQFLTAWLLTLTLGVGDLMVCEALFTRMRIPEALSGRILHAGVPLMTAFAMLFVGLGTAFLETAGRYAELVFAAFVLWMAYQIMIAPAEDDTPEGSLSELPLVRWARRALPELPELDGANFFVGRDAAEAQATRNDAVDLRPDTRVWMTPAFLALLMVESIHMMFLVDVVPAGLAGAEGPLPALAGLLFGAVTVRSAYGWRTKLIQTCIHLQKAVVAILTVVGIVTLLRAAAGWDIQVPWWSTLGEGTRANLVLAFAVGSVALSVFAARVLPGEVGTSGSPGVPPET